jgi:hypothetical protein
MTCMDATHARTVDLSPTAHRVCLDMNRQQIWKLSATPTLQNALCATQDMTRLAAPLLASLYVQSAMQTHAAMFRIADVNATLASLETARPVEVLM